MAKRVRKTDAAIDLAALRVAAEARGILVAPDALKSALAGANWLRTCVARLRDARPS